MARWLLPWRSFTRGFLTMLEETAERLLRSGAGTIEAPAGTGKTEQIARIAALVPGRWLVLTHTIAGRDALRKRLLSLDVSDGKAHVDTIAAWAFRWASAYPGASGLVKTAGGKRNSWSEVYGAAAKLINSGAVTSALKASYDGVLVDEYQDCSVAQHAIVLALKDILRCYIFGDPLQAIFQFERNKADEAVVDWSAVLTDFPLHGALETPHRWVRASNAELGRWLIAMRASFRAGGIDLQSAHHLPLHWEKCQKDLNSRELSSYCRVQKRGDELLAIIDTSKSAVRRAELAKHLYGTTLEPVGGPCEMTFYSEVRRTTGLERALAVLDLAGAVWKGADASGKKKRVSSLLNSPNRVVNPPTETELAICAVAQSDDFSAISNALSVFARTEPVRIVRPELLFSVRATLEVLTSNSDIDMEDACWQVANRRRQAGRSIRDQSVGSTLLLKGLEFDHAVITPDACATACDWYVALTRATRSIRVLSPSPFLEFPSNLAAE